MEKDWYRWHYPPVEEQPAVQEQPIQLPPQPKDYGFLAIPPPPQPQPLGFWDKMKAANTGGKVLGMAPDEFGVLMGSLAQAIAPGSPEGRAGEAVAGYGAMKFRQRMLEQAPEYRRGTAEVNALERETARIQQGTGTSPAAPQPSTVPMGTSPSLTLGRPTAPAAPAVDPYFIAQGKALGTAQAAATASNPYAVAKETREQQTHDVQLPHIQAQTEYVQANTASEKEKLPYIAPTAEAGLKESQARTKLLDVEAAYVGPKFEFEQAVKRAELNLEGQKVQLGREQLAQGAADREESRQQRLFLEKQNSLQTYNDSVKTLLVNQEKDLANPLTPKGPTLMNYGLQFIHKGLEGGGYADSWGDPSFRTAGAGMLQKGVGDAAAAVNAEQTVAGRRQSYHYFMKQILPLKQKNPELYGMMKNQFEGSITALTEGRGLPYIGGPLFGNETFNPKQEGLVYR